MKNSSARLDLRLDPAIKELAMRAADLMGSQSLSAFVTAAIREKSSRIIEEAEIIRLTNDSFDAFVAACESPQKPNDALLAAQRRRKQRIESGDIRHRIIEQESP
ncbi:MAG: DUF1778 domain-containing protein [Halomonadaceae bacterium]|nr:MAG: DUF1778 domain-containing protein [Halomonadaceae bacterium]